MVLIWVGIAVGILIATILVKKIITASPRSAVMFSSYCKKCGYKTNGLKCPRCESSQQNHQKWK